MCTEMDSSQGPLSSPMASFSAIKSWNEHEKKKKSNRLQDNSDNVLQYNVMADE